MARPASPPLRPLFVGLGRALGGALIFSLPMLMTMEMWELGFYIDRWRLLVLLLASFPVLMFLSRYSGFEHTRGWRDDLRDVCVAYGLALLASTVVMLVLSILEPGMSLSEIVGKLVLQAVPGAVGALLARSQFGNQQDDAPDGREDGYLGELGIMGVGALFLSLNVAPTEEMVLIAYRMSPWHGVVLMALSILIMHGFVYAAGFKGGSAIPEGTPWWRLLVGVTLVGYVIGLLIAIYALWTFSRLDGVNFSQIVGTTVVLGFPASMGAAAARLIL